MNQTNKARPQYVHVFEALYRKKDNPKKLTSNNMCIRLVDWWDDPVETIRRLRDRTTQVGVWRIYRTVNRRDVNKAWAYFTKTMIDVMAGINTTNKSPESLWKTELCQTRNNVDRRWLLDVDRLEDLACADAVGHVLLDTIPTPSGGVSLITEPFNPELLESYPEVSINKDGLQFVEKFEVTKETAKEFRIDYR